MNSLYPERRLCHLCVKSCILVVHSTTSTLARKTEALYLTMNSSRKKQDERKKLLL